MSQEDTEHLSAEISPDEIKASSGVRRVNNLPLIILGAAILIFVVVVALVAYDRAEQQQGAAALNSTEGKGSTQMFANEVTGGLNSGIIPPAEPALEPALLPLPNAEPVLPSDMVTLQAPSSGTQDMYVRDPLEDELERIKMAKMQQLRDAAMSRTTVQNPTFNNRPQGTSRPLSRQDAINRITAVQQQIDRNTLNDPTASYLAKLEAVKESGLAGGSGGGVPSGQGLFSPSSDSGSGGFMATASGNSGEDRWRLNSKPEAPRSPYELRAGFVIPGTLISGINSDLPGSIMAQVSQNVYDTATGRHLLIPQGSRLMGSYDSNVVYGQKRVLIAWQRIIYPDGKAMDIGAMPGSDAAGYAGFKDQVNNHYFRLFGSAILMSVVSAGISLTQDNDNSSSNKTTASEAMSEALGQQLGQVTAQLIAKNMNIAPTLQIRPGYRFNITVTKDLTLDRPYRSFDY